MKNQVYNHRENWKAEIRAQGGVPQINNSSRTQQIKSMEKRQAILAVLDSYNSAYRETEKVWRNIKKIRWQAYLAFKAAEKKYLNKLNAEKHVNK